MSDKRVPGVADEMVITHVDGDGISRNTYFPDWNERDWERIGPVDQHFKSAIRYRHK